MSEVVSKVGIHCVGPKRTGFGDFLRVINDAGRRIPVITCYDDFGAAQEVVNLWPDTLTVGMFTDMAGFPFDYGRFIIEARKRPWIKCWGVLNEIDGEWARQADLYISLMPYFKAEGLLLGMFSTASGTPPYPNEDGGNAYRDIARACKYANDHGFDVRLLCHEYVSGGTIGRYKVIADYLELSGALVPIVISEWLTETFPGVGPFMQLIRENDPVYMADYRVIGCATWTLGGGGWAGSNYAKALPELGQYIATVAPIVPPPPDLVKFVGQIGKAEYPGLIDYVGTHGGSLTGFD